MDACYATAYDGSLLFTHMQATIQMMTINTCAVCVCPKTQKYWEEGEKKGQRISILVEKERTNISCEYQ